MLSYGKMVKKYDYAQKPSDDIKDVTWSHFLIERLILLSVQNRDNITGILTKIIHCVSFHINKDLSLIVCNLDFLHDQNSCQPLLIWSRKNNRLNEQ